MQSLRDRSEPSDPRSPAGPTTFSVLVGYGARCLDAYRPATTSGPGGWRHARALLEASSRSLDLTDLRPIGEGALGWVFFARQRALDRPVAVKVGKCSATDPAHDPLCVQGATMARLAHPSVPSVYAYGQLARGGPTFLVLEWIDGPDLEALLAHGPAAPGAPSPARIVEVLQQIAHAVELGHRRGELHGDVKPANIVVPSDAARPALLVDWGGHAAAQSTSTSSDAPAVLGSFDYWSPERMRAHEVTDRVEHDLWALGATLYRALCGVAPFSHLGSAEQSLAALRERSMPWEQTLRPALRVAPRLAPRLAAILDQALAESPEQRYRSAGALAADLAAFVGPGVAAPRRGSYATPMEVTDVAG